MKKTLIAIICLVLIVGCVKKNNQGNTNITPNTNPDPKQEEIIYYTEDEAQDRLKEIAEDVYNNQRYLSYTKENGKYFISLKELRDSLNYDTKKIDNLDGLKCDENETGIGIDADNLNHVDYYGLPVITYMLCNPPSVENNQNEEQN